MKVPIEVEDEKNEAMEPETVVEDAPEAKADEPEVVDVEETDEEAPIVSEDTPFFHFDLASAVRAAEAGLARRQAGGDSETSSLKGAPRADVSEASSSGSV